tara:strand:+ start:2136 stop:2711 length:576 start_codon:yes stop_codon:yes gene_type:complete
MDISRISFKIFMDQGEDVPTDTWFEVFNTWIPAPEDDVLVDVADYTHVKNGPQTILVGHRANYALDTTGGRFGFLYARKRDLNGSLSGNLEAVIGAGLKAADRLASDASLQGKVNFNGESLQISLNDRLGAANDADGFAALKAELDPVLAKLFGGTDYEVSQDSDPKRPLTVDIKASSGFSPAQLLENLSG